MKYPTMQQVEELYQLYRTPEHIRKHMERVRNIVLLLAVRLNNKGENYDLELLDKAALLHDIAKPLTFRKLTSQEQEKFNVPLIEQEDYEFWANERKNFATDIKHELIGAEILRDYPQVAEIVANHTPRQIFSPELSKEALLLNYVDKRVVGDKLVGLDEKFAYYQQRYGDEDHTVILQRYKTLEAEIFKLLEFKPESLAKEMLK